MMIRTKKLEIRRFLNRELMCNYPGNFCHSLLAKAYVAIPSLRMRNKVKRIEKSDYITKAQK
ncbi:MULTISPECIES: hypothetical protein [Elizabethkingia]|uniref:hypothetical protein n=1 Tax=Elizabethkingia TaxID=308865 RepID=UPI0011157E64|nr:MULTISPECIES: hypothetical protein [Elizabethkingia]MBG0514288.1 hypothetical protein [Elizabethkingia meningoseptica]MDE5433204.1 hypothetical protein [Elizabethkingia meningoseptica]MDE5481804.1 hypothetical protein [Elizabethkingia meningoseptica]MDE5536025.1 hypothetical protein [Elizabethkingia meningoseptica]MDX8577164.1 hypothetical protein [Elizabethkingia sp. HX WYD]